MRAADRDRAEININSNKNIIHAMACVKFLDHDVMIKLQKHMHNKNSSRLPGQLFVTTLLFLQMLKIACNGIFEFHLGSWTSPLVQ